MTIVLEEKKQLEQQLYQLFQEVEQQLPGSDSTIRQLRKQAAERFVSNGFPTTKNEDWKYTNVLPFLKKAYQPAPQLPPSVVPEELLKRLKVKVRAVTLNGRFSTEMLAADGLPANCQVGSLRQALQQGLASVVEHYGRHAEFETQAQAFVGWNTAFAEDGFFVEVPAGTVVEEPIYLIHVTGGQGGPYLVHPRTLVIVGESAQVHIVEIFLGNGQAEYLNNAVTEIIVSPSAVVTHAKVELESGPSAHIATTQATVNRDASFTSHTYNLQGCFHRNDVNARLVGEGSEALFYGLYVLRGSDHVDNHTFIDHAAPHTSSNELFKGILADKSTGVFNGKIMVRPGAQKTNAYQNNKNLLLSYDATINTKPQLEIFADDVRCTHGATVGQLEEEAIFYLRTRGLPTREAKIMLVHAFSGDVLEELSNGPLKGYIEGLVTEKLLPVVQAAV